MMTLQAACEGTLEAKGSRFLAAVVPIAQFEDTLAGLRAAHPKANHHITAWRRLGDGDRVQEMAKDDGEPAGTAGRPVLQVLRGQDLVQVGAVVVRYFGGIKLGTGGLARAYSGAVSEALTHTAPVPWVRQAEHWLRASFDASARLEREVSEAAQLTVVERHYDSEGVRLLVRGPEPTLATLRQRYGAADAS